MVTTAAGGSSSAYTVTVAATAPGLLAPSSFNVGGKQYVAAFFQDGTFALPPSLVSGVTSRRAQAGDILTLYGVGFGHVNPNIPAGQLPQGSSTLTQTFGVKFGSTAASVAYDGLAPGLVGVYQFNVVVPSITASDAVPLTFTLNGVAGTQTLYTAVQN